MTDFLDKIKEKINNKLSPEKVLLVDNSDLHKNHKQFDSKKFNLFFGIFGPFRDFGPDAKTAVSPFPL